MAMIPPSAPQQPSNAAPLLTGHNTSARQGYDPATGQPLPSSAEVAPPPQYSDAEQRKINAATGRGFRRTAPNTEAETGEPLTLRGPNGVPIPCKYCDANPCHGISWVFEGELRFKCDACGNKQKLGYLADVANKTHAELEGIDRAEKNRLRMWREDDVKREEERQRMMDDIAHNPENPFLSAVKDRGFVDSTFFS